MSKNLENYKSLLKEAMIKLMNSTEDELQNFLSGKTVVKAIEQTFKTWKTITLGTHKSVNEITEELNSKGFKTSDWAKDIMTKKEFTFRLKKKSI